MALRPCSTCGRSISSEPCPFCAKGADRRAAYVVVAAVSSLSLSGCSGACVGRIVLPDATPADAADEPPSWDFDAALRSDQSTEGAIDAADSNDADDADASLDGGD